MACSGLALHPPAADDAVVVPGPPRRAAAGRARHPLVGNRAGSHRSVARSTPGPADRALGPLLARASARSRLHALGISSRAAGVNRKGSTDGRSYPTPEPQGASTCSAGNYRPALSSARAAAHAARPWWCARSPRRPQWPAQPRLPGRTTSGQPRCRSRAGGADAQATKMKSSLAPSCRSEHSERTLGAVALDAEGRASPARTWCACRVRRLPCNYAGTSAVQPMLTVRPLQPSPKSLAPTSDAEVTRIIGEPSRQVRMAATSALHSAKTAASPFSRGA